MTDGTGRGFFAELAKACPALPCMALGLWLAWLFIMCSGTAWLSDTEVNGANMTTLYLASTGACGVALLLAAFLPERARRVLGRPACVMAGAGVSAAGCLLVILVGPYYLYSLLDYGVISVLFRMGGVLGGLGSAATLAACARLYGALPPRRAVLYAALSHAVAALTYFLVIGAPEWAPVAGGPSLAGIVAFVGLPLAAGALACLPAAGGMRAGGAGPRAEKRAPKEGAREGAGGGVVPSVPFTKLAVVSFAFAFVMMSVRAVAVEASPVSSTFDATRVVMLLRMFVATGFACAALGARGEFLNFGKIYSVIMAAAVALVALLPIVGVMHALLNPVVLFVGYLFDYLLWCILAFVTYQRHAPVARVYGSVYGCYLLGCAAGWGVGAYAFPVAIGAGNGLVLYLALALAVLVCAFVLFSEKEFDNLFRPAEKGGASLDDLLHADILHGAGQGRAGGGRGLFRRAIEAVSAAHALSPRETDVLRCLAMGYDSTATAKELNVSWNTARTHTRNVYAKLGVHSRQEVIDLVDEAVQAERRAEPRR